MDTLNHGLWGAVIGYGKYGYDKTQILSGFLFGALPDALVFAPSFVWMFLYRQSFNPAWFSNLETAPWVFRYAVYSYNFTHSLVIAIAVIAIVTIMRKGNIYWPMMAWPLHILMDIPTHTKQFFPTPFLYPISDYKFDGVSWGNLYIMSATYGALLVTFLFFRFRS